MGRVLSGGIRGFLPSAVRLRGALCVPRKINVIHSFLLFPTIERMAETPNGRIATPLLCWFRYALYATGYLLLKPCPEIIKSFIIKKALEKLNFTCEIPLKNFLHPFCLANAAYLGSQEMMQVGKRDDEAIQELLPKVGRL
ncbi:hypothetical protein U0070_022696 [Myodes glareolus]|uniref:Uncharacterized protein n=1 Tax=Myodes glareolus TaxID=447135 RepID=A0AAW0GYC1_MYOGA